MWRLTLPLILAPLFACTHQTVEAVAPTDVTFSVAGAPFLYTLPAGYCRISAAEPRHAPLFAELEKVADIYVAFVRCDELGSNGSPAHYGFLTTPHTVKGETVPAGAIDFRSRYSRHGASPPNGKVSPEDFGAAVRQAASRGGSEMFGPISLEESLVSFGRISAISGRQRMGIGIMAVLTSRPFTQYVIAPVTTLEDLERQNELALAAIRTVRRAH